MAGKKYRCDTCGLEAWRPRPGDCIAPYCTGTMVRIEEKPTLVPIPCKVCATIFMPRNSRQEACPGECGIELKRRSSCEGARRRYEAKRGQVGNQGPKAKEPWAWLRTCVGEDGPGKRKILNVLEDKTDAGEFPWPDVLAGGAGYTDRPTRGMRGM